MKILGLSLLLVFTAPLAAADIELRILPRRVEAVVDHRGPYVQLAASYAPLRQWISRHGWTTLARPVAVYFDDASRVSAHRLRSQARYAVNVYGRSLPSPATGKEKARLESVAPSLVLTTIHVGAYDQILATYELLRSGLDARGLRATGPMREVYIDDPTQVVPAKLRTEVQLMVEPDGKVDIGIYCDFGAFATGVEAASLCFTAAGLSVRPLLASDLNDGSFRKNVGAVYFPGGWAEHYVRDIDKTGVRHLARFVKGGGGYLGICAGSYYAARAVKWQGESLDYELDLFPGVPDGPIVALSPWPLYVTTQVTIGSDHVLAKGRKGTRTVLYYGGPALQPRPGADLTILARFGATGDPAMVAFDHGKGRVFLSSAHLEYDLTSDKDHTDWPELEKGINDPESDWDLLQAAARWVSRGKP